MRLQLATSVISTLCFWSSVAIGEGANRLGEFTLPAIKNVYRSVLPIGNGLVITQHNRGGEPTTFTYKPASPSSILFVRDQIKAFGGSGDGKCDGGIAPKGSKGRVMGFRVGPSSVFYSTVGGELVVNGPHDFSRLCQGMSVAPKRGPSAVKAASTGRNRRAR
jgi:hypothetical protein